MVSSKVIKKILTLFLIAAMLLSLTACSEVKSPEAYVADPDLLSDYEQTRTAEIYGSFADEVEKIYEEQHAESSSESVKNEYDITYLGWTYFEWATAKESEKLNCANAYMGYIGDLLGLRMTSTDEEQLETVKESLGKALKNNPELSVKEIVLYFYSAQESSAE